MASKHYSVTTSKRQTLPSQLENDRRKRRALKTVAETPGVTSTFARSPFILLKRGNNSRNPAAIIAFQHGYLRVLRPCCQSAGRAASYRRTAPPRRSLPRRRRICRRSGLQAAIGFDAFFRSRPETAPTKPGNPETEVPKRSLDCVNRKPSNRKPAPQRPFCLLKTET